MERLQRYMGSMLGLACGDALGAWCEFRMAGSFEPFKCGDNFRANGTWRLPAGTWTDDTSMALCLAESLVETRSFLPRDQLDRYCRWWRDGHLSATGNCFDIGAGTARALSDYRATGQLAANGTGGGNGSLMRLAPVPLVFAENPEQVLDLCGESSLPTHGAPEATDACRYFGGLIVGALQGRPKAELLSPRFTPLNGAWDTQPLHPKIDAIAAGSFARKEPPQINGGGYCVSTLEAVLWAFARNNSFEAGVVDVVNLGDDTDSTAAVYGALAGAYYGVDAVPLRWREGLVKVELVRNFAQRLYELSEQFKKPVGELF